LSEATIAFWVGNHYTLSKMKLHKALLFILVLPMTIFLDFILYSFTKACPSCGSFTAWLETEGALSFPVVVGLSSWFGQLMTRIKIQK